MKKKLTLASLLVCSILIISSCKKEKSQEGGTYSSVYEFLSQNAAPTKVYTVNASTGGSFTTSQGTVVNIPANNFVYPSGRPVTGMVNIEFKDIYKKSDMLFADVPTVFQGAPLKSAGEFFIRAKAGDSLVQITNKIDVQQPANGKVDSMMLPFIANVADSIPNNINVTWNLDSIRAAPVTYASNYVFSLYNFAQPFASGTWCNSDNPYYFQQYPTTTLTLQDTSTNATSSANEPSSAVFLVFKNINCMIHVYENLPTFYPYSYAPVGLDCTVVAVGINSNKKLVASFTPITISSNQTVLFGLTPITETDFEAKVKALD